jgi:hypothetical protein
VPIRDLLKRQKFLHPREASTVCEVFEDVLNTLGLVDRQDTLTTMIARKLVELAKAGVRDPVRLKQMTLRTFANGKPSW